MVISTYEFTKTTEFKLEEDGTLKGVVICGPGRDQRRYYAVTPMLGEGVLSVDILEEALNILELFNKEGYNIMIEKVIPATIKAIVGVKNCK